MAPLSETSETTMPKLTKTAVDAIKTPEVGDAWVWDSELEGFGVRIQKSGRKTFVVRYRMRNGLRTQRKLTICRCTDMPPEKARDEARKVFAKVAQGEDPAALRKSEKSPAATVERLFEGYIASLVAKNKSSAGDVRVVLLKGKINAGDAFGRNRPASEVTTKEVMAFLAAYHGRGKLRMADKSRGIISAAYSWALKSTNDYTVKGNDDWGLMINPAACIATDQKSKVARDRNLTADQIRRFWIATESGNSGFSTQSAACLRLIATCGQRVLETLRVTGSEIDLQNATWNMPKEKTKMKKFPHIIPLPAMAVEIFRMLIDKHGNGPLFPGSAGNAHLNHCVVSNILQKWCQSEDVDFEAFTPRDLRRTWKSRTHDAGIDRFTRDLLQQHAKGDTSSKHYDRADYLPQERMAMTLWNDWLEACVKGKPMDDFIPAFRMNSSPAMQNAPALKLVA